jgi:hypothetical protein
MQVIIEMDSDLADVAGDCGALPEVLAWTLNEIARDMTHRDHDLTERTVIHGTRVWQAVGVEATNLDAATYWLAP